MGGISGMCHGSFNDHVLSTHICVYIYMYIHIDFPRPCFMSRKQLRPKASPFKPSNNEPGDKGP